MPLHRPKGMGVPYTSSSQVLTPNGWSTVSGSGANTVTVTVDFGTGSHLVSTAVTGQAWVTSSSAIVATVMDKSGGNSAEDAAAEGITVTVGNLVNGDGFTVYAASPEGSVGQYLIACTGA
jgi:hypothetical protein